MAKKTELALIEAKDLQVIEYRGQRVATTEQLAAGYGDLVAGGVVMKFGYQDFGAVASITITSTIFEFRKHNRVVDTALFLTNVNSIRTGHSS